MAILFTTHFTNSMPISANVVSREGRWFPRLWGMRSRAWGARFGKALPCNSAEQPREFRPGKYPLRRAPSGWRWTRMTGIRAPGGRTAGVTRLWGPTLRARNSAQMDEWSSRSLGWGGLEGRFQRKCSDPFKAPASKGCLDGCRPRSTRGPKGGPPLEVPDARRPPDPSGYHSPRGRRQEAPRAWTGGSENR